MLWKQDIKSSWETELDCVGLYLIQPRKSIRRSLHFMPIVNRVRYRLRDTALARKMTQPQFGSSRRLLLVRLPTGGLPGRHS